jgi:Ca-activated chloride channel family protein
MRLGPILRDAPLHVLVEFIISPNALDTDEITILNSTLKTSITSNPMPAPPIRLHLTRSLETNPSPDTPPTQVLKALSRLTLYRLQERAQTAVDAGQVEAAVRHLQNLATHLLSQGEHALAKTALFEADTIERMHSWSTSGSKDIKYQTRALLLDSGKKEKAR